MKTTVFPFRHSLADPRQFTLTFELVPGRSARGKEYSRTLAFAREAAADGRLQAVSITENAGGHPALSPEVLGIEICRTGLEVIIHLSCKDKNRNQMESLLYAWDRLGLNNLLVITGDYPGQGYQGHPKPVFDLGSVQALDLIGRLNRGSGGEGETGAVQPTGFFQGVVVSPFKMLEAEQMLQYFKLHRKAAAGAEFVITQLGFDARKFQELLLYMRDHDLQLPVLGNVFVPSLPVLEQMYRGRVPGCIIPEALYLEMQREARSPDRGRKARLVRAGKLLAVLKGLGYKGAHIGGPGLSMADLDFMLATMAAWAGDWQAALPDFATWPASGFYYYDKEPATGLNQPVRKAAPPASKKPALLHTFARAVHRLAFAEDGKLYPPLRNFSRHLAASRLAPVFSRFEHAVKFLLFKCRNCGDCTLAELAFLCPQAGCAKFLLNGPCGGSRDGWCEVYPGQRRCLFVRVYERLKGTGREGDLQRGLVPPRDWSLDQTSSWLNFYLGKDHYAKTKAAKIPALPHTSCGDSLRQK